jgi:O-antigen ligase
VLAAYLVWRCGHATDQFLGRIEMGQILAVGLAFGVAYGGLTNTRARFVFLGIVLAGAVAQAVVGFFQFAQGGMVAPLGWFALDLQKVYETRFATRAHGLYVNPNQFAWLMGWATLSCLALATWARVHVVTRVVLIYLALMFLAADLLSGSRGGLLGLIAGGMAFGLMSIAGVVMALRRGRVLILAGAIFLVLLCAGFGAFIYSSNWVIQGRVDAILFPDVREALLEHAWRQFEAAPLVGMGPGAFIYAARLYRTGNQMLDAVFAHDDWLQTLVEYGFVGFSLALLTVLVLLWGGGERFFKTLERRASTGDRPLSSSAGILLAAIAATVMFFVHSFTDFNLHIPANALLAGATLGLLAGTGGDPAGARRLPAGILRTFSALGIVVLTIAVGFFAWLHGAADFYALRAANAEEGGHVKEALVAANKGLEFRPDDAQLQTLRGRALSDFESAEMFARAENDFSGTRGPDGKELTPETRRELYQSASDAFAAAIAQQPMERSLLIGRATALLTAGHEESGGRNLIEAIRLDPGHSYAYGAYGDYLYEKGNLNRALRIYALGAALPGGSYCGQQAESVREELAPPPRAGGRWE